MKPAFGGLSHLSCATSSPTPVGLSSSPKPVYLRPSQLMLGSTESPQQGTSQSPSPLKPPSLGNPFARGKFMQSFLIINVKTVQNTYLLLFWVHCMSYPLNSSKVFSQYHLHILRITCGMTCMPTCMWLLTRNSADRQSVIFSEVNIIVHLFGSLAPTFMSCCSHSVIWCPLIHIVE